MLLHNSWGECLNPLSYLFWGVIPVLLPLQPLTHWQVWMDSGSSGRTIMGKYSKVCIQQAKYIQNEQVYTVSYFIRCVFPNLFKHTANFLWHVRQIEKCSAILLAWQSTPKVTTLCKWALVLGKRIVCLKGLSLKLLLFLSLNIWEAWSP